MYIYIYIIEVNVSLLAVLHYINTLRPHSLSNVFQFSIFKASLIIWNVLIYTCAWQQTS